MNYKVVFVSNFFNHHQEGISDSFYRKLNGSYCFIETEKIPQSFIDSGYPILEREYLLKYDVNKKNEIISLINDAEVVIFGSAPEYLFKERIKKNKFTFRYSERIFKKSYISLLSPRFWYYMINYNYKYANKNLFLLCAGGFTKKDFNLLGLFINKSYKWGYFPKNNEKKVIKNNLDNDSVISFIWVGRFIDWKHPELAIYLINDLVNIGKLNIKLDMYGVGHMIKEMNQLISKLNLKSYIKIHGAINNDIIQTKFCASNIFLFTSDRNEGWGVVLNEAMLNKNLVIVSDEIGAAKYLIKDGENGLLYKSKSSESLFKTVLKVIDNFEKINDFGENAHKTIVEFWNPEIATSNFLDLIDKLKLKKKNNILDGPCSKA